MRIAILSNGPGNYSTKRLREEAEKRGHEVEIIAYKKCYVSIDEKNPKCELALDGGLRVDNMEPLIECNPDVIVMSSALFKDPDGITAAVKKCRKVIDDAAIKYNLE